MPRTERAAAKAAKRTIPDAVKLMEKAARKEACERTKNKKQKQSTTKKGKGPAKQNKGGKKGNNGGSYSAALLAAHKGAFPGPGRRLDSEPGAGEDAKKAGPLLIAGATIDHDFLQQQFDGHLSALMDVKNQKELSANMRKDVAAQEEMNKNNAKLSALLTGRVQIKEAKGGCLMDGGGIMLGREEDYMDTVHPTDIIGSVHLNWKTCTATYKSDTRGGETVETFRMYPAPVVLGAITLMFDEGHRVCFSEVHFPSMKNLFWSMGYHFVIDIDDDEEGFEPESLIDIFKEFCGDKDWDSVSGLGERDAKVKSQYYKKGD